VSGEILSAAAESPDSVHTILEVARGTHGLSAEELDAPGYDAISPLSFAGYQRGAEGLPCASKPEAGGG